MKLYDWMKSAADMMGPGGIARHHAVITRPKKVSHWQSTPTHSRPQGVGHEEIRGDASSTDFNNTRLWDEPSASDTTARNWRTKRNYEKVRGRNVDPFEAMAELNAEAPCGCKLKVGDKVVVEGMGKGMIAARNNRILTISFGADLTRQVDQTFVHAYGTSEGVKKEWETRGRGEKDPYVKRGMPLKGHPYHEKTDESLRYIMKDAREAADAMGNDHPNQGKYLDQINDAATVLGYRQRNNLQGKTARSASGNEK